MQYVRLYSDENGDSHFAEAALALDEIDYRPPAPAVFVSHAFKSDFLQFIRLPGGWTASAGFPSANAISPARVW